MGKPLIHMIPSQETRLRGSLINSKATSDSDGLQHNETAGTKNTFKNGAESTLGCCLQPPATARTGTKVNGVKRSPTNASNESGKTSKSNSTIESCLCSFVPSNASLSSSRSSDSVNHSNNEINMALTKGESSSHITDSKDVVTKNNALVPESIITSGSSTPVSSSSKMRIAIKDFEESIEITRQNSIAASTASSSSGEKRLSLDERAPSTLSSSPSLSSMSKTNKTSRNHIKKAKKAAKGSGFDGNALTSIGRSVNSNKIRDETAIMSISSYRSSSFGSTNPRFEVMLDESHEKEKEPTVAAAATPKEAEEAPTIKLANVEKDAKLKGQQNGFDVDFSSAQELHDLTSINPGLVLTQRSNKSRQRQQSITATTSNAATTSSFFFSAIDKHVATRRSNKQRSSRFPNLVQPNESIEVLQSSKDEEDVILVPDDTITTPSDTNNSTEATNTSYSDLNSVLSPSTTQGARQSTSTTAAYFQVPPSPTSNSIQKKKIYAITGGQLVVHEVDEAIEVNDTGSVIMEHVHQQPKGQQEEKDATSNTPSTPKNAEKTVRKPYRLMRLEESNATEVLEKPRSKTPSKSRFRRKNKRTKKDSSSVSLSRNPIKVVSDDENTDAIEILRTRTNIDLSNTFSYDENEEDFIIQRVSPPPSPVPPIEGLQIIGEDNDIEIVVPSSKQGTKDESMEKIVSIRKLSKSSSSRAPIKILSPVPRSPSRDTSAPPKKFEPVIEIPSNHVEEHAVDVMRAASYSTQSSLVPSISYTKPSGDSTAVETEVKAPKNGDQLVFIYNEQSTPKIAKTVLVPKIPAPKKDTSCKNPVKTDEISSSSSIEYLRKVRIQVQCVQKADGNTKIIEISSVATPDSSKSESKVSVLVKQYSEMAMKNSLATQASKQGKFYPTSAGLPESKHIVHVNVLGVAGIVVDRKHCRDVTGNDLSPSPPEQMTAVVGISESSEESIDNVTTFSSALIHAPNTKVKNDGDTPTTKEENEAQRHIAVWTSNSKGETPGSVVESKILNLESTDKNSKHAPKFLDLNVALAKSGEDIHHAAVVIGKARIEITEEMISGNQNRTIDLPVYQLGKEGPSSSSGRNCVILLRTTSKQRSGDRKLCVEQLSNREENGNQEDLTSAYSIDPMGDSMIRIQVRVEEVHATSKQESIQRSGSSANRTAATERSEESSIRSGESPKQPEGEELYSKPIDFPDDDSTFHSLSRKGKLLASKEAANEADFLGFQVFGTKIGLPTCTSKANVGLAGQIDDRIEDMAEHVFSGTCAARNKDDSSLIQDDAKSTANRTYYTGATDTTQRKLIEEMKSVMRPVPSLNELRSLVKEFALTSGEYFFSYDGRITNDSILAAAEDDDDDNTSVGSATLMAIEREKLKSQENHSLESWKKKRDDDNMTYSTRDSDNESRASVSLNQEDVQLSFNGKRRVMSENNKFDIDGNRREVVVGRRSFDNYPDGAAQLDVGCEGDDEESTAENRTPLVDEVIDEGDDDHDLRRQSSGKPSLPSVVENIAEVLSIGGKACGYFSADKVDAGRVSPIAIWNRSRSAAASVVVEIPETVDQSDLQSVGELTAITLEKNEIKEKNRKLLVKRLGLPKEILGWSTGGKGKEISGDGMDTEESQAQNLGSNSEQPEDYFADYEEGTSGVRSIYGSSEVSKQIDCLKEAQSVQEDQSAENSSNELSESSPDSKNPGRS
jgi:hypothetical protein